MSPDMRSTHLYICGSTGTGKSKMLEYLIRQDISKWPLTKCGLLLLDPHGSLYDGLMKWIVSNESGLKKVPIVPIDLRQTDWTVGYNVIRPRTQADTAVIVDNFLQAMAYVWGVDGTNQTPLFARVASTILWTLYEGKHTLLEAEYMIDRTSKLVRSQMAAGLSNRFVAKDIEFANSLSPLNFDNQISSTVNRFRTFLDNANLRLMFGQAGASLDLGKAIEAGSIILVNLSTEGAKVNEERASLLAKERGKGTDSHAVKPFYVYIDEFQNFVTPTIAKNLDQARGFGLHLTLANQFPRQILHTGANGPQVYDSVMANARSKIVFSVQGTEHLRPLAEDLFIGVLNPDEVKHELYSTKVLDYAEETRTIHSSGRSWSNAAGNFIGQTGTESLTGRIRNQVEDDPNTWNRSMAESIGTSEMSMQGGSEGTSEVPIFRPVMGKELSSVQFRPLEEQIYRASAALHDQKQRHAVVRLVESSAPVCIVTPKIEPEMTSQKRVAAYVNKIYKKLPFALPSAEAKKSIEERQKKLLAELAQANEVVAVKRRIADDSDELVAVKRRVT